ncbi:MAG: hypothetical protein PVH19_10695, partial [Planctomycetia bacterium]
MLLRKILGVFGPDSVKKSSHPRRRPLRLEPLENRQMLSITLFVDADSAATNQDGLDWVSAYSDLQDALNRAA